MMYFMDDKVDMRWGDSGFGYGCGDKYIITAYKFENKLCGDVTVFSADDGKSTLIGYVKYIYMYIQWQLHTDNEHWKY